MSAFLALTAAMAGTAFNCTADTAYLTAFAPAEEVTADYRGNVLTLYSLDGDGEILPKPYKITEVFDDTPHGLFMEVSAAEGLELLIDISSADPSTNMADLSITGKQDGNTMELAGTCTITQNDGKEGA
ncbi:hypothetical protein SZ64_05025 [Erythrobacter sp. SG61-1L]|uniref:hypothetical protein n=1 Tax=Erythrobacter sp. SG61-1L TaxID=1603897 RepID=UPI0006D6BE1E|nr:hypothetical protein [Erythrobacter sp. SG61-1L]KPL67525.1 hypothetical protein SZ64_05025 [Erythrobacter sp. SG61-1L]